MELFKIAVWPLFALILVALFYRQISASITRLTRVKFKDLEIELQLENVETKLLLLNPTSTPTQSQPETSSNIERLKSIANASPRAAVLEAWLLIETAAAESGFIQGADVPRINTLLFVDSLEREGRLPQGSLALVRELRNFRDRAAASQDARTPGITLTASEAERYITVACAAAEIILEPSIG